MFGENFQLHILW